MQTTIEVDERRTSADVVFDYLHEEINSLNLLPGAKISEAEIATRFGVSRQPVRDAFSRLGNLDLVQIRPQKATRIKKFSLKSINAARFVRLSVELEVLSGAVSNWSDDWSVKFDANLAKQAKAVAASDAELFHRCDYEFHKLLCQLADAKFAFDIIQENKSLVDRLCVLSLTSSEKMEELLDDHKRLLQQIATGNEVGVRETIRLHLSRLNQIVESVHQEHAEFFEA